MNEIQVRKLYLAGWAAVSGSNGGRHHGDDSCQGGYFVKFGSSLSTFDLTIVMYIFSFSLLILKLVLDG